MKKLDLLIADPGTQARLKLKPNKDVVTFLVFVKKFTQSGSTQEAIWHPERLTSKDGAVLMLENVLGYKLILHASIKPGGSAEIDATLKFDGKKVGTFPNPFSLPDAEGPVVEREWSIVVL